MSRKDLERLSVLKRVLDKELRQIDASRLLKITDRQVRKLVKRLEQEGPAGIVSKLVGRRGNRHKPPEVKQRVLALLREKYEGFGPTGVWTNLAPKRRKISPNSREKFYNSKKIDRDSVQSV